MSTAGRRNDYLPSVQWPEPPCRSRGGLSVPPGGLLYLCTRATGHEGDHAAHGPNDEMLDRWPRHQDGAQ